MRTVHITVGPRTLNTTFTIEIPETTAEAIQQYGEDFILNHIQNSVIDTLMHIARKHLLRGTPHQNIQNIINHWPQEVL